jgi:outer membrane immunogenic protein
MTMMKSMLGLVAISALITAPAIAADLRMPVKAPPPPAITSWTGCYVNAGGGYGFWKQNHFDETDPGFVPITQTVSTGGNGWLGTVGGGCDFQVGAIAGGNIVIGAFADYDFMNLTGTYVVPVNGLIGTEKESGAWAVGGRIGYAFTPTLMGYVNAGWTEAKFDSFNLITNGIPSVPTIFSTAAQTYNGWFIGGGTEVSLAGFLPHGFFLRSEYRYASYGAQDVPYLPLPLTFTASHETKQVQTITTSLVWKFNFGGPLAARY